MRVPLFADDFASTPVARVDGEAITAEEVAQALAGAHGQRRADAKAGAQDLGPIVGRLVNSRLIVAEARDSGLDELPKVAEKIAAAEEQRLKDILRQRVLRDVKADPARVARAYENLVTGYRMRALNFNREEDAKLVAARMAKGASFADVAAQLVSQQKAKDAGEGWMPGTGLGPAVGPVVRRARPPAVLPPIHESGAWIVIQLLEVSRKDDPARRAEAEADQLAHAREEALKHYYEQLTRLHAKVDRKLLRSLDWDAPKPGAAALLQDKRVLAQLSGGAKITVADLGHELERHFWHGLDEAAAKKKIGPRVQDSWNSLLFRHLLLEEAARQRLRETDEFRKPVRAQTERILFNAFLENAVAPSIKVGDDEVRGYYEAHKADYVTPGMVRLDGLGFADAKDAEAALSRLKAGTDMKWLKANADGVLPADAQSVRFEGVPVTLSSLPPELAKALQGAKEGDYRLYAGEGQSYVVQVVQEFPPGHQPLESVQKPIFDRLFGEKVQKAIDGWADKVRPHHEVELFVVKASE
jgi:parvulin-like peptidyl-prolyl isomerase